MRIWFTYTLTIQFSVLKKMSFASKNAGLNADVQSTN